MTDDDGPPTSTSDGRRSRSSGRASASRAPRWREPTPLCAPRDRGAWARPSGRRPPPGRVDDRARAPRTTVESTRRPLRPSHERIRRAARQRLQQRDPCHRRAPCRGARSTVSSFEAMSPRPSTRRTGSTIGANELAPDGTQRASSTVARSLSKRRDPRTRGGSSRVRATRGRSRGGPDRRRPLRRRPRRAAQDRPRVRRRKSSPSSAGRCLRQVASRRPALPCPSSRGEERAPPGGGRGRSDRSRYP